jgi:hypothetical protein
MLLIVIYQTDLQIQILIVIRVLPVQLGIYNLGLKVHGLSLVEDYSLRMDSRC